MILDPNFRLLMREEPRLLEKEIQEYVRDGWVPVGSMTVILYPNGKIEAYWGLYHKGAK